MPRVILPQKLAHGNLCNLAEYGELVYLFSGSNDLAPSLGDNNLSEEIAKRLSRILFDSRVDFFAATGTMTLSHVVLATLVKHYGEITCLLYDKDSRNYRRKVVG